MTRTALCGVAVLLTVGCSPAFDSRSPSAEQQPQVDGIAAVSKLLRTAVADEVVPGAVVLVARRGQVVHRMAYGYAQLFDRDGKRLALPEPMTVDHVFDLASLSKVFGTTLGMMILVDRGQMGLDDPIARYVPAFRGAGKDSVVIRHLLSHSAGLFPWKPIYFHASDRDQAVDYVARLPLAYAVGRERHYSDLGFMLLGHSIEIASGRPIDAFLREELYQPLGLERISYTPRLHGLLGPFAATSHGNPFEQRMVSDSLFGYRVAEDADAFSGWRSYVLQGEVNDGNAFHAFGGVAGHAGLFSTADDLRVLLEMLLGNGRYGGKRYVDSAVVDSFVTRRYFGNGLGWAMSPEVLRIDPPPPGAFGHTGFTGTYAVAFPSLDASLILLTNRQNFDVGTDGRYPILNHLRRDVAAAVLCAIDR